MTPTRISERLIDLIRRDSIAFDPAQIGPSCMDRFERLDWQSYVPGHLREIWRDLPLDARLVAYCFAIRATERDDINL
jgi:hypothetical protein